MHITEIDDLTIPELDVYTRLGERELLKYYEPHGGLFIAESPKVICRALDAGYEPVSLLAAHDQLHGEAKELISRIAANGIPVFSAPENVLRQLTGFPLTRGVLCAMKRKPLPPFQELCRGLNRIAVLENVMNPTNVGAIFRSAAAMGMDAVLLTEGSADPLYRRAIRVSMGTVFQIPWTMINHENPAASRSPERNQDCAVLTDSQGLERNQNSTVPIDFRGPERNQDCTVPIDFRGPEHNHDCAMSADSRIKPSQDCAAPTASWIPELKKLGFTTCAMALQDNARRIDDPVLKAQERLAVILGTEGDGLAASTIADCDYQVIIPMTGGIDSLNVAAASAVAFWELGKTP